MRVYQKHYGYTNLGPIRIPPLPPKMVFTDREDGTLWLLSHSVVDGMDYVSIDTDLGGTAELHIYPVFEEPILSEDPRIRLLVRDGFLGYELVEYPRYLRDKDQSPVRTRDGFDRRYMQIIKPSTWQQDGDVLGYEAFDI